ncbi:MAG: hypothetical protein ACAH95_12715 [Fimbriimonas sp.]
MITQERTINRTMGTNPVAVTRAFAKARMGDESALRWLIDESHASNAAATKAIKDLARLLPQAGEAFAA